MQAENPDTPSTAAVPAKTNRERIRANRRRIFEAESLVHYNTAKVQVTRTLITENHHLLQKNYMAAGIGNRTLSAQNTEDIFRARLAFMESLHAATPVEEDFRRVMVNRTRIQFIEHQSKVACRNLEFNQRLEEINQALHEVIEDISQLNSDMTAFNNEMLELNKRLMGGEFQTQMKAATSESKQKYIQMNTDRVDQIRTHALENRVTVMELFDASAESRKVFLASEQELANRRTQLIEARESIDANEKQVVDILSQ
jgi:hypothetical protein